MIKMPHLSAVLLIVAIGATVVQQGTTQITGFLGLGTLFLDRQINGGTLFGSSTISLSDCLLQCNVTTTCMGIDYLTTTTSGVTLKGCFQHTSTTICSALNSVTDVQHIRLNRATC